MFKALAVFLLLTATAFSQYAPLYQKDGAAASKWLGASVASAGDVNGDGKDDFIIGVPWADPGWYDSAGSAYIYSGATGALLYQKDGATANDRLGWSVASAGDVDGDGAADFIIAAPWAYPGGNLDAGSAYVYSGATGALLYQKDGAEAGDVLGWSVASAGDVDGDGRADFIIGAVVAGSAYVYSGATGALLYQKDVGCFSVASAGDVDGDGRADFIIGNPYAYPGGREGAGSAYLYSGATGALLFQKDGAAQTYLGWSVASAGDVDGDGRADFIIGAPFDYPGGRGRAGSAYLYSGATGALLYQKDGAAAFDQLGLSVASAGDVNGDGRSDFIIGAPFAYPGGREDAGSAYLYSGATGALLFQRDGAAIRDNLGYSVASAGDVSGDGRADFIIGAPNADPRRQTNAGTAYVYGRDLVPPVITCRTDTTLSVAAQCSHSVAFSVSATDNFPGVSVACTPPPGSTFIIGTTAVTCIATDAVGNQDTCGFLVTLSTPIGDMNGDAQFTPDDALLMLYCVFLGSGYCGSCFTDVDCDGGLSPSDAVLELSRVFLDQTAPPWCGT